MTAPLEDPRQQARHLRQAWDERGRSSARDFFVASHAGWEDPRQRDAQARIDASLVTHGLEATLAGLHVLEIGCGVGRLAGLIAPRARSYTGVDVAPSMVAEARRRQAALTTARFFEGDGLELPPSALDRPYGLIFAHAVFIHCPRSVIAASVRSACAALARGGELRFQLRADPADAGGLAPPVAGRAPAAPPSAEACDPPTAAPALAQSEDYMGPAFGWDEARRFVAELAGGMSQEVFRLDPAQLYARILRSA